MPPVTAHRAPEPVKRQPTLALADDLAQHEHGALGTRRTGITHLLEAAVPLKVVQEIAGHRSARTTIETYAHATETMQRQAIEAMDRALG